MRFSPTKTKKRSCDPHPRPAIRLAAVVAPALPVLIYFNKLRSGSPFGTFGRRSSAGAFRRLGRRKARAGLPAVSSINCCCQDKNAGFTLLEVMIALGLLFGALAILINAAYGNVKATNKAKRLTVATGMARATMLDIEEELLFTGFQEMAETMEGDFSDEDYPRYTWRATIEKLELPEVSELQNGVAAANDPEKEGESQGGLLGSVTGMFGADPNAEATAAGALSQFGMVKGVLENAFRKVTLTVEWKVGNDPQSLVVVCYFTDPKVVDQAGQFAAEAPQ